MPKVAKKSSPVGVAAARVLLLLLFPPLALFAEDVLVLRRILGAVAAAKTLKEDKPDMTCLQSEGKM
jgi:hypothetical protein